MRIAVTGASGRVGTVTVRALAQRGHEVVAVDRRLAEDGVPGAVVLHQADVTSYEACLKALDGAQAVVHLAGINAPIAAPEWQVHNLNVVASYNVLSAAAELGIHRVVQSSSVNAVGLSWSRQPTFDYFPIDLDHRSRNEDGYSLSKLVQELQADSLTRRADWLSVVSLRLHAVLHNASEAGSTMRRLGEAWAVNGLFGYCTTDSVVDAIERACTREIRGHERLWVVESSTFVDVESATLAERYYPRVPIRGDLAGRAAFFDVSRTREVLGWTPSTELAPPETLVKL